MVPEWGWRCETQVVDSRDKVTVKRNEKSDQLILARIMLVAKQVYYNHG